MSDVVWQALIAGVVTIILALIQVWTLRRTQAAIKENTEITEARADNVRQDLHVTANEVRADLQVATAVQQDAITAVHDLVNGQSEALKAKVEVLEKVLRYNGTEPKHPVV